MKNKKLSLNLTVSLALFVVYVGTFLIDLFTINSITTSSVILCVGALIVYTVFLSRLKSVYYLGILIFTFFAQYLGAMLNVYTLIPFYDFLLHLFSGTLLVFLADYVFDMITKKHENKNIPTVVRVWFCGVTSIASAAAWEIWEFSGDKLLGLKSQLGSLDDTMSDVLAGTVGAAIGIFALILFIKKYEKK